MLQPVPFSQPVMQISADFEIQLIATLVATSCALLGCFLVLRKLTMLTDAIAHAVLPGIVIGYLVHHHLNSPLLMVGAAMAGVATVWLVETIFQSGTLRQDAAIGVVFPALFALGVYLISRFASDVHLDTDVVLLGELAFAPFDRVQLTPTLSLPRSLIYGGLVLVLNIVAVGLFWKELKLAAFDQETAQMQGFRPLVMHYGLMLLVSVTSVFAFDVVGSILVVSFFAIPATASFLLVRRLDLMIGLAIGIAIVAVVSGYQAARVADVSIAGAIACFAGLLFFLVLLFAPDSGTVARFLKRRHFQQQRFSNLLLVHLLHHAAHASRPEERDLRYLHVHLNWRSGDLEKTVEQLVDQKLIRQHAQLVELTDAGRLKAENVLLGRVSG